jgi:hypothetical protein
VGCARVLACGLDACGLEILTGTNSSGLDFSDPYSSKKKFSYGLSI